jgi:hypothetical protein
MPEYLEVGEVAYRTFCTVKGYTTWKKWSDLPETEKEVWRQVAQEIFRRGWQERLPFLVPVLLLIAGPAPDDAEKPLYRRSPVPIQADRRCHFPLFLLRHFLFHHRSLTRNLFAQGRQILSPGIGLRFPQRLHIPLRLLRVSSLISISR